MRSKKRIDLLFEKGKSQVAAPIKAVYMPSEDDQPYPAQALFVVPKRSFKKAHDRNRIRRRMKESYRLQKHTFYPDLSAKGAKLSIAFIYISPKEESYAVIADRMGKLLGKLKR